MQWTALMLIASLHASAADPFLQLGARLSPVFDLSTEAFPSMGFHGLGFVGLHDVIPVFDPYLEGGTYSTSEGTMPTAGLGLRPTLDIGGVSLFPDAALALAWGTMWDDQDRHTVLKLGLGAQGAAGPVMIGGIAQVATTWFEGWEEGYVYWYPVSVMLGMEVAALVGGSGVDE